MDKLAKSKLRFLPTWVVKCLVVFGLPLFVILSLTFCILLSIYSRQNIEDAYLLKSNPEMLASVSLTGCNGNTWHSHDAHEIDLFKSAFQYSSFESGAYSLRHIGCFSFVLSNKSIIKGRVLLSNGILIFRLHGDDTGYDFGCFPKDKLPVFLQEFVLNS